TIKLPKYFPLKKAKQYSDLVNRYSKKFKVEKALVYAIIHSESSFNPLSKSYVPAYGLMQIVPRTAGIDAYYFVYKRKRLLSASYLYRPKNNIELGSAYLHILYYNYFKNVKNPESRLYCTIAGYNTGAGNVARAFVGKVRKNRIRKAVDIINQMSPDEVYRYLIENLPYDETKRYLQKVAKRVKIYRKINL
ncbi:MAG TPA: transglycosylase, partial [Campylobacterales bacterium]|nr:transglycosylase [Campylobacterales bacterium]